MNTIGRIPNLETRTCRRHSQSPIAGVLLLISVFGFRSPALPQDLPSGFVAEPVVTGINAATALTIAPDGRVFFAEQTGTLRVFKSDRVLPEPALDLGGKLDTYWERGLIGVTLHPGFPLTPHLFVVYVAKEPFSHHVVSRFTVVGDRVDPASELTLLEGDDQATMGGFKPSGHQGGPVRVGPDGKLYIGLGEQTSGQPSQRLDTLIGKILRINPDGSIPEDNPFYSGTRGKYRAVWAYGIRNPFGLVFEPGSGRLWQTDVGQTSWEEVNIISLESRHHLARSRKIRLQQRHPYPHSLRRRGRGFRLDAA